MGTASADLGLTTTQESIAFASGQRNASTEGPMLFVMNFKIRPEE